MDEFGSLGLWINESKCVALHNDTQRLMESPAFDELPVERFRHRAARASFSSAANLVGYFVKEMESIAEW